MYRQLTAQNSKIRRKTYDLWPTVSTQNSKLKITITRQHELSADRPPLCLRLPSKADSSLL